ncbi:YkgJ family cysteine cluster protein [Hydrogenophaga sp. NFH-34]|uniref:YkgJ family cysteine cluster protein n=1 Tax=Hydrogenophaga sp. NFH-34 TaxID=2744446 RepID=UPI001F2E8F2C|nr:YkgJ family cysteine cluster protein [Hydrogenophaga sp. NFH-34]
MISSTDHEHMKRVRERVSQMDAIIASTATNIKLPLHDIMRLGRQAKQSLSTAKRVFWLRKMSAAAENVASANAACRRGCSHCCHIDVMVSRPEAAQIARETGQQMMEPLAAQSLQEVARTQAEGIQPRYTGEPCPFLEDGECSIYDSRPLACRVHFNMDVDDLLCRLIEGCNISVPYLDVTLLRAISLEVIGLNAEYADIRDWFGANRLPGS